MGKQTELWFETYHEKLSGRDISLLKRAADTLEENIWNGESPWYPYRCIRPFRHMDNMHGIWNWDTAFHAITVSRWDTALAQECLEGFMNFQLPDGMFPDVIWANGLRELRFGKPPVLASACEKVYKRSGDKLFLKRAYSRLLSYESFMCKKRKFLGMFYYDASSENESEYDRCVRFESGWDNSVRWDDPCVNYWPIDLNCFMVTLVKNSITQITGDFIKKIGEIFKESEKLYETEEKIKLQTQNLATSLVELFIEQIDNEILRDKKKRKAEGYSVERRGDRRSILFSYGQVEFERTYYKKASGGYEYLADTAVGINEQDRISENMLCSLAAGAKDMSYAKASRHITGGKISRQTVMNCVRESRAEITESTEKRAVSELHIDADEAHVTLIGGKKSIVPLVSVYEGIETIGKRKSCKNVFHISEYGKNNDDFWEQVSDEIEKRYILDEAKIYLHADGGGWIQKGLEWLPNAKFVLDKYHKNKAIKAMTAGMENKYRNNYDKEIREALNEENLELYEQLTDSLIMQNPDRAETISQNAAYLQRFVKGISICKKDERANNGGCTEPHISHVLAARLSSRPLAWSETTLKHLAPILAAGIVSYFHSYYESRRDAGLVVEKKNSLFAKDDYTDKQAERNILANPFKRFEDMHMLRHTKTLGIVQVDEAVWKKLSKAEKAEIEKICDEKLEQYYSRFETK